MKKVEILVWKEHFKWMAIQPARPDQKKGHEIDSFKGDLSKSAELQKYSTKSTDL